MICLRSKFGFCRFGQQCQMTHFSESCVEKSCTGNNCDKRHPIACIFFERFGRCKFGVFCAYRHDKSKEQIQQEEVNSLREEVDVLKKEIIKIKTEKENTFSCDYCDLTYKTEKKLRQHIGKKHEDLDKTLNIKHFWIRLKFLTVERYWHFQQRHDFMKIKNFTEQGYKIGRN